MLWIEIDGSVLGREEGVELRVEDTNDLRRLVVDDGMLLLVPKNRDRESTLVILVGLEVQFTYAYVIVGQH